MKRLLFLLLFAFLTQPSWAQDALHNQLRNHPSPYLALHGQDPVAWQEWNAATVERARRENKLLFISIGYFSCHWCHVMQRESYRNPEIAKVLNESFIPVKVDREIDAGLDAEMQAFAEATRGQAGWPLNVFVTPEGYPLFSILYAPPQDFLQTIRKLAAQWQKDGPQLARLARDAVTVPPPAKEVEAQFAPQIGVLYRRRLVLEALAQADTFRGGFGTANKFPQYPQLAALLTAQAQEANPKLAEFLKLTLDQMARLGLHDHVAGGFFRYTVDPDWHVPHFEKMLYDNAQLAMLYLQAARSLDNQDYLRTAFATLDFMLAEMRDPSGAFITSTSAIDDKGREGGVYLWEKDDLKRLLTLDEYVLAARIWQLDAPPENEYGYLPMNKTPPTSDEAVKLKAIYAKLKVAREARVLPKDRKLLAGLNGLALSALSQAAANEPRYKAAARSVRDFLVNRLITAEGLSKGVADGKNLGVADLEDYAYVSAGLLDYAEITNGNEEREAARRLIRQAWATFHTARGWTLSRRSLLARPYYQLIVSDGQSQAPSSVLVESSWRLGGKELRTHALKALNVGYDLLDQGVFWYATQVSAMTALQAKP
jgi:uncharacterized protein YyaL (SSP411 family)